MGDRHRLALAALIVALTVVACGPSVPTTTPRPTPSSEPDPTIGPSAAPSAAIRIEDDAYLAGDAFSLPLGEDGVDWLPPTSAPVMPNGEPAVRVGFVPESCPSEDFLVSTDQVPEDPWERTLREGSTQMGDDFGSWPAAQVPECVEQRARTYLEVGYHPLDPTDPIHLVASPWDPTNAPDEVRLVPVFTSADATQPAFAMPSIIGLNAQPGSEKPRSTAPTELASTTIGRADLPDGSTPTRWTMALTGCAGEIGPTPLEVMVRLGAEEPATIGICSDGHIATAHRSWQLPADGTPVAVLTSGGTTKSKARVSEFQWRGDRD